MSNELKRGFTGKQVEYKGVVIGEFISGYAYARNGNAHNPTPERSWVVFGEFFTLLRKAKAAVDEFRSEK